MPPSNSLWIDLHSRSEDIFMDEHHRTYNEFHKLRFPDEQAPQMIMLIGDKYKSEAVNKLQPSLKTEGSHNEIHLHLLPTEASSRSPVLLADCELHNAALLSRAAGSQPAAGITQRALTWRRKVPIDSLDAKTLAHLVYSKLISPFSNVICLFADDLGGKGAVAEMLALWLISFSNRSSDLPASTYPRVLILTTCELSSFDEERATIHFMKDLAKETRLRDGGWGPKSSRRLTETRLVALLKQQFGGIRVLALPHPTSELRSRKRESFWESLRARIFRGSQHIQDRRRKARVEFSASHFQAFFHLACDHFSRDIVTPFSFIKASRQANPLPQDFSSHIANFVKKLNPPQVEPFGILVIASALALDSYPPEMHGFPPESIFQMFYYDVLRDIDIDKEKVKALFCEQIKRNTNDTAVTHKAVLSQFKAIWQEYFDNETCISCFARKPEDNTLDCGHSFCDSCVVIHGLTTVEEPWSFVVNPCPLCKTANKRKFCQRPYTAGIRCLVLNGTLGDVFAAKCLQELQTRLGLKMKIQDCFDIVFGTGSGASTLIGLVCGLSIDECITLSESTIHARSLLQTLPLTNAHTQYSSTRINHSFKKAFGPDRTLFDCSGRDTKVALVVTSAHDASTYILSNYNGPTQRPVDCGYSLLRPQKSKNEILLWQAVRAAISSPPLLKSFHGYHRLENQESLRHLAFWEQNFVYSRQNKSPDVFLSLGPGIETLTTVNRIPQFLGQSLENSLSSATDSLLASLFYIKLLHLPLLDKVGYVCRINIQCRLLPSEPYLRTLVNQLYSHNACFHYSFQDSIPCVDQELFKRVKNGLRFSKYIEIKVLSLKNTIDIKIDGIIKRGRSISNCPYIVDEIIKDQGLDCFFGNKDHRRRYQRISRDRIPD